jgi:sugar/nucleoside kinase (ribokinase family)
VEGVLVDRRIEARLSRDPEQTTGVAVVLDSSVVASSGASARLAPRDIPDPLTGDALLVSGFSLFQESSAAGARAALERFTGRWVAVDLASPRLAAGTDLDEMCSGANVVLATADEVRAVSGLEPGEAVRELAARFGLACVKLGEEGALAANGEQVIRARVDAVTRRSRSGAGDAFAAALLVSLANGQSIDEALDAACATGARAGRIQRRLARLSSGTAKGSRAWRAAPRCRPYRLATPRGRTRARQPLRAARARRVE